ncbi:MAG: hypothetical protein ACKO9I_24325 [Sphaerospermopsis kisseleviana]|jgi:hypothetical protein|uniref:Uncharacterized protein n=2 Tax=Sphaerospermopsis TaxID=752201 RepID=A0A480A9M9_9CYAN|nr:MULTISPECIES: hypothetical protein [Sphaerospermopsis]MEB3148646.1 hypothetical protein [Sphaerospermopsis sp.]MBC5795981.1 hypothetical protein [Sphaerospermopsis sp. LEGE 00249]MBD2133948.1 hypothetical protein [Sphaerospermopsis sp. FACHB-1094]MBD2146995.1 hypothetical protein [Sphaerospermopsis sp. FACHB-1194]MBE9236437.1 hypothetical protein [Sphaerospermopsis aphanizomenoides LEGE 00250]
MLELMPLLNKLSRAEKLQIIQYLASQLVQEESELIKPGMSYPVSSPYDAFEAANIMLKVLEAENSNHE